MMKAQLNKTRLSLLLLSVIYLVGFVSVALGHADQLMQLSAVNLLFVAALLLYNAEKIDWTYAAWFLLVAVSGYLIELAGVSTGVVFGSYAYGSNLGVKLFEVPLMIGVNWAMLVFATAAIVSGLKIKNLMKAAIAASVMVIYDLFLEPVAIRFDFWSWETVAVPLQNYVAWWIIAFVMLTGVFRFVKPLRNSLAIFILSIQLAFFILLILVEGLHH
ncbi:MAG: carotenoid biosynthesis protein [Bacteroidales bacterium]|nr:carotenoid biosynthesis protein [Bacteroidales bacterium]